MQGYWHGLAVFDHDVVAAVHTVHRPTGNLEFCDDLFARHALDDRSKVI